ncbi:ricin-type beta-trefoil lectin domain protein [Streptomyces sp. NPDC086033]|uniref:ricin-type beta-trefoil lectin domain protein n=1 Tax=Streptomyces sp. NPDC086033 TaxID=3365747 RepID=UPI0037D20643
MTETNSATFDDAGRTATRTINGDSQSFVYDGEGLLTSVSGFGAGKGAVTGPGGLCLDDAGAGTADGTVIQIYTCNGSPAQKFSANGGKLTVLGKCVTAAGTASGSAITLKTCVPDATTQSFALRSDGTFYNATSKLCLNAPATTAGTDLTLAACTASASTQKFALAATTSYLYDADGNRIAKTTGGWTTLYLGETEVWGSQTNTSTRAVRTYAQAGAPTVVRYTSSATSAQTLAAQISNTQGTGTVQIKLASGMAVATRSYDAWGNLRGDQAAPATWAGSSTYIGGADESSTGLIHLGARDYDPVTGRFTTIDPVMDLSDLLQLGGYAYADNSPVTKEDPNGQFWGWSQIRHKAWQATKAIPHALYEYSGAADAVSCATHPTLGPCLMTSVTVAILLVTRGQGEPVLIATRAELALGKGLLFKGTEQAAVKAAEETTAKATTKVVEKKVVKTAEEKAAKAVEKKTAAKATERSAAKTAEKDAGRASDAGEDAVEAGGKCNSFTPNTRVLLANGKSKAIKDLRPGDKVKSTDPVLGGIATQTVTATIQGHGTKHLVRLTLSNGKSITATDGHPIWLPKEHRWAKASELRSGDWLQTSAGTYVQVTAVKAWTQTATVNNLTVSSTHTYYVLAGGVPILVHNSNGPDSCPVLGAARAAADTASTITPGKARPAVAEALQLPGGQIYSSPSIRGVAPKLHPDVQAILDDIPEGERGVGHGRCGLAVCVSDALSDGFNPTGSRAAAIIVRSSNDNPMHGMPVGPCDSCVALEDAFDVTFEGIGW